MARYLVTISLALAAASSLALGDERPVDPVIDLCFLLAGAAA